MRTRISVALLLAGTLAAADDRALVGRWESINRGEGGIGSTLQLNPDGSLSRTVGAMTDNTYTFDGSNRLTITSNDPKTGRPVTAKFRVKLAGDTLVEKNGGGRGVDIQMTRRTPLDIARPLVGTWQYPHSSGATAFVTFTDDGHELVRVPLRVDGGSWVAVGDRLTLNVEGSDPVTSAYRTDRNMLTLVESGKEFKYRRVRY